MSLNDSVRLKPNNDFAVITGVVHNLHCLVYPLSTTRRA